MKILIFGGTTEGRLLAAQLARRGARVTVSVATPVGEEELAGLPGVSVTVGRLDTPGLAALASGFDWCIDATHPYACQVTENLRSACRAVNVPLRRLMRPESRTDGAEVWDSCAQAADFLRDKPGNVLLTVGSKELPAFAGLDKGRIFARVLPTHDGISACEALGLPHRNILALQGPFSRKMNEAMLEQYQIAWLVTKDGGAAGGFAEKLAACRARGVRLLLIRRPADQGARMETILAELEGMLP